MYPIYNKVENAIGTYLYMQYYAKKRLSSTAGIFVLIIKKPKSNWYSIYISDIFTNWSAKQKLPIYLKQ